MLEIKTLGITASNRSKADFPDGIFAACRADGGLQGSRFNAQRSPATSASLPKMSSPALPRIQWKEVWPGLRQLKPRLQGPRRNALVVFSTHHVKAIVPLARTFIRNSGRPTHSVQPTRRFLESRIRVSTWLSSPASSSPRFFSRLFSSLQTATGTEAT